MATKERTNGQARPVLPEEWETVAFGDVVRDVKVSERDPISVGLTRYVGLEHIQPRNLHLSDWGDLEEDEVSFTKRFSVGQVLFGKRRAYQRKVALADFDGICSSDILTFEAKQDRLLPELLPFLVQSNDFLDHALDTSSGSLSPRTKWSQLKNFTFPLPPITVQKKIAESLWTLDDALEARRCALSDLQELFFVTLHDLINHGINKSKLAKTAIGKIPIDWQPARIGDVVTFQGGAQPPREVFEYSPRPGFIRLMQIRDYKSDEFATYIPKDLARRFCSEDDVMIGRYGPPIFQILRGMEGSYNVALIKAIPNDAVQNSYLYYFLKQRPLFNRIEHLSQRSSGQTGVDMDALKKYPFPVPPMDEQIAAVAILDRIEQSVTDHEEYLDSLFGLKSSIISDMLLNPKLNDGSNTRGGA